jgi:hypothetical protein
MGFSKLHDDLVEGQLSKILQGCMAASKASGSLYWLALLPRISEINLRLRLTLSGFLTDYRPSVNLRIMVEKIPL